MKHLLLLLLLANGVFFLWERYVRPGLDSVSTSSESAAKLDNIVLVRELPPIPKVAVSEPLATVPATAQPKAPAVPAPPPAPASVPAAVPPPPPKPAEPAKPKAAAAEPPKTSPATAAAEPTAAPVPAPAKAIAKPAAPAPAAAPQTPTGKPAAGQCRRLGPLASDVEAQALSRRLAQSGNKISVERVNSKKETGYWVMYPPAANLEAARANKRLLMQKGATEANIVNDGEYALGVSLGFFKDRAHAEKALGEARAKGLAVTLKPRVEAGDEYWLKLQGKPSAAADAQWQVFKEEHPGTAVRDSVCP